MAILKMLLHGRLYVSKKQRKVKTFVRSKTSSGSERRRFYVDARAFLKPRGRPGAILREGWSASDAMKPEAEINVSQVARRF